MNKSNKKVLLTGGGTGGSVSPLLAICKDLKKKGGYDFLFVGTKDGVERKMVERVGIRYKYINAGKLRRYFSLENFIDPFKSLIGFFESLALLTDERPDIIISAGSFVSVPLVFAGWLFRISILVHQQDAKPGLANKIMAPLANVITVTLKRSLGHYGKKAIWTGNPIQFLNLDYKAIREDIYKNFNLRKDLPVILAVGGGTGAVGINDLIYEAFFELTKFCQIIHSTGKGKLSSEYENKNYYPFEFLDQDDFLKMLYISDLAITRAGLGTLTELVYFKKPAIIIPMPDTHQEDNARVFSEDRAAIVLNQKELNKEKFISNIKNILENKKLRNELKENISHVIKKGANEKIVEIISKF